MRVLRRLAQGAGSGLLMFAGADSMTANAASPEQTLAAIDITSLDGIAQSVLAGTLTGPMQIIAAILLFVAAGKCVSRFAGLFLVAAVLFLHMQGVTLNEATSFLAQFSDRVGSAVTAFQSAQV
jgi:hypothetical protein